MVVGTVLSASFAACSSSEDAPLPGAAGSGGQGGERPNPAAGGSNGGDGGRETIGGSPTIGGSNGGEGGREMAGAGGCSLEDECGGCVAEPSLVVRCAFGTYEAFEPVSSVDANQACELARTKLDPQSVGSGGDGGGGGGGGTATGAGGVGGASVDSGICATYNPPGHHITHCGDCTETETELKVSECVIRDECCVVVSVEGCAP
jgi:hypothetical protein